MDGFVGKQSAAELLGHDQAMFGFLLASLGHEVTLLRGYRDPHVSMAQ